MQVNTRPGTTYVNEDQSWIGKTDALRDADTITIDRSGTDFVTAFPDHLLPSGIVVDRLSSGLYVPHNSAAVTGTNESISLVVDATAGTYTLTLEGDVTPAVAFNATAAVLRAALEALPAVNPGDVTVTGGVGASGGGTPYVITFVRGVYADRDAPPVTAQDVNLSGGGDTVVPTTTAGGAGTGTPDGFLVATLAVDPNAAAADDIVGALMWHGEIIVANLPTNHGLDQVVRDLLAAKFRFID